MNRNKNNNYSEKLISIIIPTYNSEKTIKRALESICSQKVLNNFEIIVVDDNSTDNTIEIIKEFKNNINHKLILIENKVNMGSGVARKIALKKASGFFTAFLDSDDYWLEDKLSCQLNFLQKNIDIDFVYTDYLKEVKDLNNFYYFHMRMPNFVSQRDNKYINFIPNSSVLIKSNISKQISYPSIRLRNDFLFWNRILLHDKKIKAFNINPGTPYFIYGSSQGISRKNLKLLFNQWRLYRKFFYYSIMQSLTGIILNMFYSIKKIISIKLFLYHKKKIENTN